MSRPTVSKARTSYPLYSATWATSKPSYLIVGGGGGAGRHGVKNKISVFDFSSRAPNVEPSAEIDASEHDSVTCLASLGTKDGAILYAGINDSEEERLKGQNEHLKAFEVQFPKTAQAKVSLLSKTALFTPPASAGGKKEGYQRIVRLSPPVQRNSNAPNRRIGAVASCLAGDENEIVVFSAISNKPENPKDIIQRITLHKSQEANDLDILDEGEGIFQLAYCLNNDVYVQKIQYDFSKKRTLSKGDANRIHAYTVPFPDLNEKKGRSKIRCIRWFSPSHILLLVNKPNRSGAELLVLKMYRDGNAGSIILRKTFPKHVQAAVDMDVALLDADEEGAYQAVVAVAAIDVSLTVLTIDYQGKKTDTISRFSPFATYKEVHELQMTKVVFSPFFKPEPKPGKKPGPQYLRLATTSLGNSIDVETFELYALSNKTSPRYVLQSARSRAIADTAKYIVIAMIVAAVALILQGFVDPDGSLTKGLIPESMQNAAKSVKAPGGVVHDVRSAANPNNADSPAAKATHRLRDLLHLHQHSPDSAQPPALQKALIVHHDADNDGALSTEVHEGEHDVVKEHTKAKRWEELEQHEQHWWREKLVEAGLWTIEEGETILKGVFFGQAGAIIGRVAAEVLG
ncbi:hypothetical protein BU23DRAFT_595660 [Bimuria novae-zelandiae CBS 107.79]|uniref:Guanine nucleotide-exchange factor SEC12 n=1 Tax=Bimuria novae-zelandiae CBS 107.79 TaxID=1447943 RepID=A0A6A5VZB3_9PLEO|nr:hypothetical protein BU23DRAFT_595660 [Bimuria novae-zelandiae CBS 107.79]